MCLLAPVEIYNTVLQHAEAHLQQAEAHLLDEAP
jgi:hypothetical protein